MPWTVVVPAVVAAAAGVAALVPAGLAAGVTRVARAVGVLAAGVFAAGIVGTNGVLPTLGIWVALRLAEVLSDSIVDWLSLVALLKL